MAVMAANSNFVYDQWLAQLLQRDVYQLMVDDDFIKKCRQPSSPEYRRLEELKAATVFMYAKVPVSTPVAVSFLEEHGFKLIDTNVTLEKPIVPTDKVTNRITMRFAVPADQEQIVEVARKSFTYSRFHLDSAFPPDIAEKTRAEWIKSYFMGNRGDTMVVALAGEVIIGFLLLIYGKEGWLTIDLIAVAETHRKIGIARDMIRYAESKCQGFSRIRVGTQLANLPSLRLYEGMGFKIAKSQYTFHYHHE